MNKPVPAEASVAVHVVKQRRKQDRHDDSDHNGPAEDEPMMTAVGRPHARQKVKPVLIFVAFSPEHLHCKILTNRLCVERSNARHIHASDMAASLEKISRGCNGTSDYGIHLVAAALFSTQEPRQAWAVVVNLPAMRLQQDQVWKLADEYVRIVHLERLEVKYKRMNDLASRMGTHHHVTKKEFCRLIKQARLLSPEELRALSAPSASPAQPRSAPRPARAS